MDGTDLIALVGFQVQEALELLEGTRYRPEVLKYMPNTLVSGEYVENRVRIWSNESGQVVRVQLG